MKNLIKVLLLCAVFLASASQSNAQVQVRITTTIAPPVLRVYTQPFCPGDGYIWIPGYWAYGDDGYYWVPGVWVLPPAVDLYWTPGYWAFENMLYVWYPGYWGASVGYYGGINYGFGYFGTGYIGGKWQNGRFYYNTAVNRINKNHIRNVYVDNVGIRKVADNRPSFNGAGGVNYKSQPNERRVETARQVQPTQEQRTHDQSAVKDKGQFSSQKNKPTTMSMDKVGGNRYKSNGRSSSKSSKRK
ncbi:YXWGXW repeat-containing protein [Sphingobacterium hungaricum]|uniref:YXWGXW repeat-containing protein n=1 Tax=Sphingobacterium hungaricum TaxID=2082723 RepID=A0A928UZR3_9SPHI|nr:YXWGXW repeat-containing protein [Sphingobacterium hungaricum]MBE8714425.1 hypothetical protein [Sphingobacterium hungaricum]